MLVNRPNDTTAAVEVALSKDAGTPGGLSGSSGGSEFGGSSGSWALEGRLQVARATRTSSRANGARRCPKGGRAWCRIMDAIPQAVVDRPPSHLRLERILQRARPMRLGLWPPDRTERPAHPHAC